MSKPAPVQLNVRVSPVQHQQVKIVAAMKGETINSLVTNAIDQVILREMDATRERLSAVGLAGH